MKVSGHCLVWHQQTPDWFFRSDDGGTVTREKALERMRAHISAVVGRYKGRVKGWDVVNEAFDDGGRLRRTPWMRAIGPDFIEHAFRFAHALGAPVYFIACVTDGPLGYRAVVRRLPGETAAMEAAYAAALVEVAAAHPDEWFEWSDGDRRRSPALDSNRQQPTAIEGGVA